MRSTCNAGATVRCLRWEDPLPKGVSYHLACRTRPRVAKRGQELCARVRACACLARRVRPGAGNRTFALAGSMGRDAMSRVGGSDAVFPPLGISYQPTGGAGRQAGRGRKESPWSEWAFTGTACATEPQGPRWAGWAAQALRPCHAAERISPGLWPSSVHRASLPGNSPRPL